jgi:hypothetical protein
METRDLSRFRTLRIFITIATLSGIDVLFFITVEPWEGAGWLAQLGLLCFLNVAVGFAIYWLMDYASTPELPEDTTLLRKDNKRYKESLTICDTRTHAEWLAFAEVEIHDKRNATTYQRYDTDARMSCLWVINKLTLKESHVYHFKKND